MEMQWEGGKQQAEFLLLRKLNCGIVKNYLAQIPE